MGIGLHNHVVPRPALLITKHRVNVCSLDDGRLFYTGPRTFNGDSASGLLFRRRNVVALHQEVFDAVPEADFDPWRVNHRFCGGIGATGTSGGQHWRASLVARRRGGCWSGGRVG